MAKGFRKKVEIWMKARRAEHAYARELTRIARHIGAIVRALFNKNDPESLNQIDTALREYSKVLRPWAKSVSTRMVAEVARRDWKAWKSVSEDMGVLLRKEIETTPIGQRMQQLVNEQVNLITSLPLDAARRVQDLSIKSVYSGDRPAEIVADIMRTGHVTEARARLIARTETGRASTALTQARAEYADSEGYIWRTVKDSDVRPSHRRMEGKFVRWDSPPTLDRLTGHAGSVPNCRCFCEPVFKNYGIK